jgi:hypothetical protein
MQHVPTVGGQPVRAARRWPRVVALSAGLFAVLVGIGFWSGLIKVYDAPGNAGVVVGWTCHNLGYEWRGAPGDPGFFANSCD